MCRETLRQRTRRRGAESLGPPAACPLLLLLCRWPHWKQGAPWLLACDCLRNHRATPLLPGEATPGRVLPVKSR